MLPQKWNYIRYYVLYGEWTYNTISCKKMNRVQHQSIYKTVYYTFVEIQEINI